MQPLRFVYKRLGLTMVSASALFLMLQTAPLTASADAATQAAQTAPSPVAVTINGAAQSFEQPPVIVNGSTLLPLRAIFEKLGGSVVWDPSTRTVSGFKDKKRIVLTVDQPEASVNGKTITLEQPALIMNGSTMVPARFVSESLGARVAWDDASRTVSITLDSVSVGQPGRAALAPALGADFNANHTYQAPNPMPAITKPGSVPYSFKEAHDWKTFTTRNFQVYYYSNESDVLLLSPEIDFIYEYLIQQFGLDFPDTKIPIYFLDEASFSNNINQDWSEAVWRPQEKAVFVKLRANNNIDRLLGTLQHEMTHAITLSQKESRLSTSTWFAEAVATYYELKGPHPNFLGQKNVYKALDAGQLLPLRQIPNSNDNWSKNDLPLIYSEAQSFYAYLTSTYGESKINNVWYMQGDYTSVLEQLTGKTFSQLEDGWRSYLTATRDLTYRGVEYDDTGVVYIGDMKRGMRYGNGQIFKDGRLMYDGGFVQDTYEGIGTWYANSGEKYVGELKNNEQNGQGKQYDANGKLIYEGSFKSGKFNGQGIYYFKSGKKYIGEFTDGNPSGLGTVYDTDGSSWKVVNGKAVP
ncbi:stalk domain-containing protein [Paenibacillus filicis]|uniref:Stalk domain-containing protein n=1 Tax=Paenibacillus gyeongsangnamensis TaxID=3388067 RepID=A0ABT4QCK0_9BACL|nr:stalk domain-containing protein [Paenibacillus filicis]MCZ8514574.1 stalk domain-containing protein [Paenibacillus filicis]